MIPVEREVDVLQGQFRRVACAALTAAPRVSPRPDEACVGGVEENGETFALRVQLDLPVRSPLGGHISGVIWALYAFAIGRIGGTTFASKPWLGLVVALGLACAVTLMVEGARRILQWRRHLLA